MSISRRDFCSFVGAAGLAAFGSPRHQPAARAADDDVFRLCAISYNVLKCTGWPKDRVLAKRALAEKQMADRLAQELALYQPHIVTFSESPSDEVVNQVAARLDMNCVRFPSAGHWPGSLLTRFDIFDSANVPLLKGERPADLFTRHWGRATLMLPNGDPLIVHSAHLFPGADFRVRVQEIKRMLISMQADLGAGRSALLMGDLNHRPVAPEYPLWIDSGWVDTFAAVGNGKGFTIRADKPAKRIDYVMAAGPIAQQATESRPLFEGAFRTNPDDPKSFALSDHLPQMAVFELLE